MKKAALSICLSVPVWTAILCSLAFTVSEVGKPFPGFLVYPNLLVSPMDLPWWLPPKEGVSYPWILDRFDAEHLSSAEDLDRTLASVERGEIHMFTFTKGGERLVKGFPITGFLFSDFQLLCGPFLATGIIVAAIGVLTGVFLHGSPGAWSLVFFCLFTGGLLGTVPDIMLSHRMPWAHLFFTSVAPATGLGMALSFPSPVKWMRGRQAIIPFIVIAAALPVFILFLLTLPSPESYVKIDTLNAFLAILSVIACFIKFAVAATSPVQKDQIIAKYTLLGVFFPFMVVMIPFAAVLYIFHVPMGFFVFLIPILVIPPGVMAWALHKTSAL